MMNEILLLLSAVLAWLYTSHALTKPARVHCGQCGQALMQGLNTPSLYCIRCRRWLRAKGIA
jgi:hypothetical protein